MTRVIAAFGDSIVDGEGRCTIHYNEQWLYRIMEKLGETNIKAMPETTLSGTPNAFERSATLNTYSPLLSDGDTDTYTTLTGTVQNPLELIFDLRKVNSAGVAAFSVMAFTKDTPYTCEVWLSDKISPAVPGDWDQTKIFDVYTWESTGQTVMRGIPNIAPSTGHSPDWNYTTWYPQHMYYDTGAGGQQIPRPFPLDPPINRSRETVGSNRLVRWVKLKIVGTMTVSELKIAYNAGKDRWSCLNRLQGENYVFINAGVGSEWSSDCANRFTGYEFNGVTYPSDVLACGADTAIILTGINDLYSETAGAKNKPEDVLVSCEQMWNFADQHGITVIPCTLLPYSGGNTSNQTRFEEVKNKIELTNFYIKNNSGHRHYNYCDWYNHPGIQDPLAPGKMIGPGSSWPSSEWMTCDGVHLNLKSCQTIVDAFDLTVFSAATHDLYVRPVIEIPLEVMRAGEEVILNYGNGIETQWRVYVSFAEGQSRNDLNPVTVNTSMYEYFTERPSFYSVYGVHTKVWSREVPIFGKSDNVRTPILTPFPMLLGR